MLSQIYIYIYIYGTQIVGINLWVRYIEGICNPWNIPNDGKDG